MQMTLVWDEIGAKTGTARYALNSVPVQKFSRLWSQALQSPDTSDYSKRA